MRYSLIIAAMAASFCAAEDKTPEQAALLFAEGLRDDWDRQKIVTATALNPDTGDRKKDQIFAAWKSESKKILPQAFEVVDRKIVGENAAILLRQYDAKQSSVSHLLSVAVVQRDKTWRAAPVLSSFENSVVSYDPQIITQRRELEQWMMSREISLREEMQTAARQMLLDKMAKSISPDVLKSVEPRVLIEGLITALRDRDEAAVLARLGGYSIDSTPEWERVQKRISNVLGGDGINAWPWRLLTSRLSLSTMSKPVDLGDETVIDMLALHPQGITEVPDLLTFVVKRDEAGVARVELPEIFMLRNVAEEEMGDVMDYDDAEHVMMYDELRKQARQGIANADFSRAESVATVVEKCLQSNDFASFWGAGALPGNLLHVEEIPEIIMAWQDLQGPAAGSRLFGRVGFLEKNDYALLVLQSYTPRNTDTLQLQKVWFTRKKNEWRILGMEPETPPEELTKWWEENRKTWSAKMADSIVADVVRIGGIAPQHPEINRTREVFDAWLLAVQEKSLTKALRYCAAFQDERSVQSMLRALAGELMYGAGKYEVLDVKANGRWTTVSAKYVSDKPKSTPQYPLYVFVSSEQGPRLLPQVDLKLSLTSNRSRTYLNNLTFTDLKKTAPDAAVEELKKLYEQHEELVKQQSVIKP